MRRVRTAIVDEHSIFRRGLVACLADDPAIDVMADMDVGPLVEEADVAVVSSRVAHAHRFSCPLVVTAGDTDSQPVAAGNRVLAMLPRASLTPEQLLVAIHAVAAGLQVHSGTPPVGPLPPRLVKVLRLLADGADTTEISRSLNYSERTIKGLIADVERELGARNRAQAVAVGIRRGLI